MSVISKETAMERIKAPVSATKAKKSDRQPITVIHDVIPKEQGRQIYEAFLRIHLEERDLPLYGDASCIDPETGVVATIGAFHHPAIQALRLRIWEALKNEGKWLQMHKNVIMLMDVLSIRQRHLIKGELKSVRALEVLPTIYRGFLNLNYATSEPIVHWPMMELKAGAGLPQFVPPGSMCLGLARGHNSDTYVPEHMPSVRLYFGFIVMPAESNAKYQTRYNDMMKRVMNENLPLGVGLTDEETTLLKEMNIRILPTPDPREQEALEGVEHVERDEALYTYTDRTCSALLWN